MASVPLFFEYDRHPRRDVVLQSAIEIVVERLRTSNKSEIIRLIRDTRPLHRDLFLDLTPEGYPEFAGNYRGADFDCLRHCFVQVPSDPLVGEDPSKVASQMHRLARLVDRLTTTIPSKSTGRHTGRTLIQIVDIAAQIFVEFLTIHPYANGNGHIARIMVIAILLIGGFKAPRFTIHPRPIHPEYTNAIALYRLGAKKPLVDLLLSHLG